MDLDHANVPFNQRQDYYHTLVNFITSKVFCPECDAYVDKATLDAHKGQHLEVNTMTAQYVDMTINEPVQVNTPAATDAVSDVIMSYFGCEAVEPQKAVVVKAASPQPQPQAPVPMDLGDGLDNDIVNEISQQYKNLAL
jgi:hypothetical protein